MIEGLFSYNNKRQRIDSPYLFTGMILVCIASWMVAYFLSIGFTIYDKHSSSPLWSMVCEFLNNKEYVYATGLLLMFACAFIVHRANYVLALTKEKTLLPFFICPFINIFIVDLYPLNPASFALFFLILAFYVLMRNYHNTERKCDIYNAAFIVSLASLLWVHALWFFPLFWMGMYLFRTFSFRTFLASLLGAGTVYWTLLGWCMWTGDYSFFKKNFYYFMNISFMQLADLSWLDWTFFAFITLLVIVACVNIATTFYNNNQRTRQNLRFVIIFYFYTLVLSLLFKQSSQEFLIITCFPISILLSHLFTSSYKKSIRITFYAFLVILIALQAIRIWETI